MRKALHWAFSPLSKRGGFDAAQLVIQPLELLLDVLRDILAFAGKLEKRLQIFHRSLQLSIQLNIVFKLLAALQNRLRLSLIIPKARVDNLSFDLAQFPALGFRVKDNSECPGFGFSVIEIPGLVLPTWCASWIISSNVSTRHHNISMELPDCTGSRQRNALVIGSAALWTAAACCRFFRLIAGSRQLAGSNSALQTVGTGPSIARRRVWAQQDAPVENCHGANR